MRILNSRSPRGFTLIELMIVVAVIAILAAIALPGYQDQVRKSRRAAAVSSLQEAQLGLERWRVDHKDFTGSGVNIADTTHYDFTVTAVAGAPNNYTVEAKPLGGQDKDVCGTLSITNTAGVIKKLPSSSKCW